MRGATTAATGGSNGRARQKRPRAVATRVSNGRARQLAGEALISRTKHDVRPDDGLVSHKIRSDQIR